MKKTICFILSVVLLSGCGSVYDRASRVKERGRSVADVRIKGGPDYVKELIQKIGNETGFIADVGGERDDFIFLNTRYNRSDILHMLGSLFFGGLRRDRLGFFLEYDILTKTTGITISEETGLFAEAKRGKFVEQLKARQGEKIGDGVGFGDMSGFGKKKDKGENVRE